MSVCSAVGNKYFQDFSDKVAVCVRDFKVHCSKRDLSTRSEFFRAMFSGYFLETIKSEVELKDVDEESFVAVKHLLNPNYYVEYDKEMFIVAEVASRFCFFGELDFVERMMVKEIENYVVPCLESALNLNLPIVKNRVLMLVLWEFNDFAEDLISCCNAWTLAQIINHPKLYLSNEVELFNFILKWIAYDFQSRKCYLFDLIKSLRISKLSVVCLEKIIRDPLIMNDSKCYQLLKLSLDIKMVQTENICRSCINDIWSENKNNESCYCNINSEVKVDLVKVFNNLRISPVVPCVIAKNSDDLSSAYAFITETGSFYKLWDFPMRATLGRGKTALCGFRVLSLGCKLLLFGGEYGIGRGTFNMDILQFNCVTGRWINIGKITIPRRHFFLCPIGDNVFIAGGAGKHRVPISKIEVYSLTYKTTKLFLDLNIRIEAACTFGDLLLLQQSSRICAVNIFTKSYMYFNDSVKPKGGNVLFVRQEYLYFNVSNKLMRWKINSSIIPEVVINLDTHESKVIIIDNTLYSICTKIGENKELCLETFNLENMLCELKTSNIKVDFSSVSEVTEVVYI